MRGMMYEEQGTGSTRGFLRPRGDFSAVLRQHVLMGVMQYGRSLGLFADLQSRLGGSSLGNRPWRSVLVAEAKSPFIFIADLSESQATV